MSWKRRAGGSALATLGFLLSPLSWWNDLFVNVPLALGFAWLVGWVWRPAFEPAIVVGYWLTNVVGFILLHKGAQLALAKGIPLPYTRKALLRDLAISLLYTALIVVLIKLKVLQPVTDYLHKRDPAPASPHSTGRPLPVTVTPAES